MSACSIDGCTKSLIGRGMCSMHYSRWRRSGDPNNVGQRRRNLCQATGCTLSVHAEGFCQAHLYRWRRYGDPLGVQLTVPDEPVAIPLRDVSGAVVAETIVDGIDSLWLSRWPWSLSPSGYAFRTERGRTLLLARVLLGLTDAGPQFQSDHINRDRLDNRRQNLRVVTAEQNAANRGGIHERGVPA